MAIFNVIDFGATPNDDTIDSPAIQAAIDAAFDAGGGTVIIPAGVFYITGDPTNSSTGAVELRTNVTLTGAGTELELGAGGTVLKLVDNFDERINGMVRTAVKENVGNATISNLTIDGNRDNNLGFQTGIITGVKEATGRIHDSITISGVEVKNANGYGVNPHEITTNLLVENSVSHNNGVDGFVADSIFGGVYQNNIAYENDRHGFNATTSSTDVTFLNNIAYDNGGAGGIVQRGDIFPDGQDNILWPSDIKFIGGEYYSNGREGINIKMAGVDNPDGSTTGVTISGAKIYENGKQGIRVDGAISTVIENNEIYNNSQLENSKYDEIQIRLRDDSLTSTIYYSTDTKILNNEIYSDSEVGARFGIREESSNLNGGPSGTEISGNTMFGFNNGNFSVPGFVSEPLVFDGETAYQAMFAGTNQAEWLDLTFFEIEGVSSASDGNAIRTTNKNNDASAKGTFVGESGVYKVIVAYFDENDGEATINLTVGGVVVDTWVADQDLGEAAAKANNLVTREITLQINQFDDIEITTRRDGNELVRVDTITIVPGDEPSAGDDNPVVAVDDTYEGVEDEFLFVDAATGVLANDTAADGGKAAVAGTIATSGGGSVELLANGSFTYTPAADFNGADTFEYTALDGDGDTDTATVTINVDPREEPEHPVIALGTTQAEVLDLEVFAVESISAADGGEVISSRSRGVEASAKGSFIGEDGQYMLTVAYFDESDGESEFGIRIGDDPSTEQIWTANADTGVAGASSSNLVTEELIVDLAYLDIIEVFATRDGGELVRIDSILVEELLLI